MSKVFVAYRKNDLFNQYVDQILEGLNIVGSFIVPQGVPFEDVREQAFAALEQAVADGANAIVTDLTCNDLMFIKRPGQDYRSYRFRNCAALDELFQEQLEKRNPTNTVAKNFAWFAKQVAKDRTVKSVIIVKSKIEDHRFAGSNFNENQYIGVEKRVAWAAEQLRRIFPDAYVNVVETLEQALESANDPETLLVLDRHCGIKEVMDQKNGWYNSYANWPYASMLYLLPFETCAANLASRGNLDFAFDVEAMRSDLSQSLNR